MHEVLRTKETPKSCYYIWPCKWQTHVLENEIRAIKNTRVISELFFYFQQGFFRFVRISQKYWPKSLTFYRNNCLWPWKFSPLCTATKWPSRMAQKFHFLPVWSPKGRRKCRIFHRLSPIVENILRNTIHDRCNWGECWSRTLKEMKPI